MNPDGSDFDALNLVQAAQQVAARVIRACHGADPPVDAMLISARLGLTIAWDLRQEARARLVRPRLRRAAGVILLRPEPRLERQQWAVAHEVGEHLSGEVFAAAGVEVDSPDPAGVASPRVAGAREQVANLMAAELLLPSGWFERDAARCGWDLFRLKQRYATASHEMIARRMLDCEPPVIVTILDQGAISWRRSNALARVPAPSAVERLAWRRARDSGRPATESRGGLCVTAWPVHEAEWKREIVRTDLASALDEAA